MMAAFDAPVFSESCPRRRETTTALQALSLLNGSLVHDAARALVQRVESEVGPDRRAQIVRVCERILNRTPESAELEELLEFPGSVEGVCRVLFNTNEFLYVD